MIIEHAKHYKTIPCRRGIGYCNTGGRPWFERHGLDWRDFVLNGVEEEVLLATGCAMILPLIEWAHECAAREQAHG